LVEISYPWTVNIDAHEVSIDLANLFAYALSGDEEPTEKDYAVGRLVEGAPEMLAAIDQAIRCYESVGIDLVTAEKLRAASRKVHGADESASPWYQEV